MSQKLVRYELYKSGLIWDTDFAAKRAAGAYGRFIAPRPILVNREEVLDAIGQYPDALDYATKELRDDYDTVFAVIKKYPVALQYASPKLRANRDLVMYAVSHDGRALKYASLTLQSDLEIVLIAMRFRIRAFSEYASRNLRTDHNCVLAAVQQNSHALKYASPELCMDREIVLAAVQQNGHALKYVSPDLSVDREIVLAAVQQNGHALKHVSPVLSADREIVLVAVRQTDTARRYALDDSIFDALFLRAMNSKIAVAHTTYKVANVSFSDGHINCVSLGGETLVNLNRVDGITWGDVAEGVCTTSCLPYVHLAYNGDQISPFDCLQLLFKV